jgi:hypothetical protein
VEWKKLENQKLEKAGKAWRAFSALTGGEGPWNGFGRRLRRRLWMWFGPANDRFNSLVG